MMLAYLIWNPSPYLFSFNLPLLGRPLLWYGLWFACGFLIAYQLLKRLVHKKPELPQNLADRLSFSILIGTLLGARLADLLFYQDLKNLLHDPLSLIAVWQGGLSSHGGALGILIALFFVAKRQNLRFLTLVDLMTLPCCAAAICIRIGNFFNQEILGTPTTLPWGVLFLHPIDGGTITVRHPAQLYEALAYLGILISLGIYYKRKTPLTYPGRLTGLFLTLTFSARFLIEWVKMEQSVHLINTPLTMGQLLSLPFILLGLFLYKTSSTRSTSSVTEVNTLHEHLLLGGPNYESISRLGS